jgi:hypothetical protein
LLCKQTQLRKQKRVRIISSEIFEKIVYYFALFPLKKDSINKQYIFKFSWLFLGPSSARDLAVLEKIFHVPVKRTKLVILVFWDYYVHCIKRLNDSQGNVEILLNNTKK